MARHSQQGSPLGLPPLQASGPSHTRLAGINSKIVHERYIGEKNVSGLFTSELRDPAAAKVLSRL